VESPKNNGYEMVNVDESNNFHKQSPFLEAAKTGDLNTLNSFLEKGEDILQVGDAKYTALHYVSYLGKESLKPNSCATCQ